MKTDKSTLYHIEVSLLGIPASELSRTIEIEVDATFGDLHAIIFKAFDRYDEHLFEFLLSNQEVESFYDIDGVPSIGHPDVYEDNDEFLEKFKAFFVENNLPTEDIYHNTRNENAYEYTLAQANLPEGFIFHYLFDFGDDWEHRLEVKKIIHDAPVNPKRRKAYAKIIDKKGRSPEQYPV